MGLPKAVNYVIPEIKDIKPNRTSWELNPDNAVLLIHDMQKYFLNCFDKSKDPIKTVISNIKKLADTARKSSIPVFYTAQPGDQDLNERALLIDFWGSGLSSDLSHTSIIDELEPQAEDICLKKWRYSAFKKSNLENLMLDRSRKQIIIVGVYGHIGCLATALEAFMIDIQPFLPIDAIADFSRDEHMMTGSYVAQRCGFLTNTQEIISLISCKNKIPSTIKEIKDVLAPYLGLPSSEISDTAFLPDLGLDSVQLIELAEKWHSAGVSYFNLVQNPTPKSWLDLLVNNKS